MIEERKNFYRTILLKKRKFISNNIVRLREMSRISEEESKKYSTHLADEGSDTIGIEECYMLLSRELMYLQQIDEALSAIEDGTYGICENCRKEIPHERLEAVPTTDTCVDCKSNKTKNKILN